MITFALEHESMALYGNGKEMAGGVSGLPTTRREEDYLEAIYSIQIEKGIARVGDVSKILGVTSPSVTEMFRNLDYKKLINYEKYGGARLTREGTRIGRAIKDRHDSLFRFLRNLDVPEPMASIDACALEHILSPESIMQIKMFNKFVIMNGDNDPIWLSNFKRLCKQGILLH